MVRMLRQRLWLLGVVALAMVVSACTPADSLVPTRIIQAGGDAGSRQVELNIASCGSSEIITEVDEGPGTVNILVKTRGGQDGADCAESTTIQLDEPLGSRSLTDGSTGNEVSIVPLDS